MEDEKTQNNSIELTAEKLLGDPIGTVEAVEKLVIKIKNGEKTTADDYCRCSRFDLIEMIQIMLESKPHESTWDTAWKIYEEALQTLQREKISETTKT